VIVRLGELEPRAVESGGISRESVAAAGLIRLQGLVERCKDDRLEPHAIGAEIVRKIEFRRRALLHADRRVVEFKAELTFNDLRTMKPCPS